MPDDVGDPHAGDIVRHVVEQDARVKIKVREPFRQRSEARRVVFFGVPGFVWGLLVYLKSMYTSLVVMVNAGHFLWIMAKSGGESRA